MFYVAASCRMKFGICIRSPGDSLEYIQKLNQRYAVTIRNVYRFADALLRDRGINIGVNYVRYICKIPRLLAVALDDRGLCGQKRIDKARNNAGVWRRRILSWPEDVEVTQRHCFEPIYICKRPA